MEALLALLGLLFLAVPVLVVVLLVQVEGLKRRVYALEQGGPKPAPRQQPPAPTLDAPSASRAAPGPAPTTPPPSPTPVPAPAPVAAQTLPPREPSATSVLIDRLVAWLKENWFYAVSGLSLALAGIFLVQYGVERGLLPPPLRILAALLLGAALVAGGEYVLRRFGDGEMSSTAYLPSVFSGAGMVTLFGAIFAARGLYDLINPAVAFAGLSFVGTAAIALGWRYGPLLSAIGVTGSIAAPFLVGGSSSNPSWLFGYFLIIACAGLTIDALQRWAWISVLSLVLAFGASALVALGAGPITYVPLQVAVIVLAGAGIAIPRLEVMPRHDGPTFFITLFTNDGEDKSAFPTYVAAFPLLAACAVILLTVWADADPQTFRTAVAITSASAMGLMVWTRRAPALTVLPALPWLALVLLVPLGVEVWQADAAAWSAPDGTMPLSPSVLVGLGIAISLVAAWRSFIDHQGRYIFAGFAGLAAPALAIAMDVFWHPGDIFVSYGWALHALIIAIIMMGLAERFHKADGYEDRLRVSFAVLSGLASIAFAMVILFSQAALTAALSVTIVTAAALDRRFTLPPMAVYVAIGVVVIMSRLVVDPGLDWARQAPLWEMLLSHGGALIAFAASWVLLLGKGRQAAQIMLDSAAFASGGILLSLLLYRAIKAVAGIGAVDSHWSLGLGATIWLALSIAQLRRQQIGGKLNTIRAGLAIVFIGLSGLALLGALTVSNPLFNTREIVLGPILLTSLIAAYLLPAALCGLAARFLTQQEAGIRRAFAIASAALTTLWFGLTIRHFWRGGSDFALPGIGQGELYTYTLTLLAVGAALFYRAIAKADALLRKAGLVIIGIAIAKVFLIDISGLDGLTRVFSLLILGLALAALAWLNRWAARQATTTP